ncbi:hypothetical protein BSQ33_14705 [Vibrio gazogenes]|uniref:Uncharacterized protein n=1 Tax=Vibrio gazogenes TaxID=687 RepID=A0A1Z2SI07_VIBGA|nr:hypothetical protein BSQ33_14705 [Vibrio gazogenes]
MFVCNRLERFVSLAKFLYLLIPSLTDCNAKILAPKTIDSKISTTANPEPIFKPSLKSLNIFFTYSSVLIIIFDVILAMKYVPESDKMQCS